MTSQYVHGYEPREGERLRDQAGTLADLLHGGTAYESGSVVLEAGCAVGAQTLELAGRSPGARFVAVDLSVRSAATARDRVVGRRAARTYGAPPPTSSRLPFGPASFDHVFASFVLEHLERPQAALELLRHVLRPGGTITVIEGDHGSAFFHPDSAAARAAIGCQVTLQAAAGGDALIGRQLYPLLVRAGFGAVGVSPRLVYVDGSRPDLIDRFTRKTFTAMIEGTRQPAIAAGLSTPEAFDAGIRDLYRTAGPDGSFCYTFFKATAIRSR